jgi:rhodanese-related sulfurtransferase
MEVPKPSVSAVPELVTVTQVKEWMDRGIPLAFVDSRSATAWEAGSTKARGALRVPPAEVSLHLEEIPRDHRIIVYCT